MNVTTLFLAQILDKFKAKNPKVWGFIAVVLLMLQYAIIQGNAYGLFEIDGIIKDVLQTIVTVIGLLVGSRTSQILATQDGTDETEPVALKPQKPPVHRIKIKEHEDIEFLLPTDEATDEATDEETPKPQKHRGRPRKLLKE